MSHQIHGVTQKHEYSDLALDVFVCAFHWIRRASIKGKIQIFSMLLPDISTFLTRVTQSELFCLLKK